ncbi:MAG: heavy metal sensor histidine kinase [Legionellales bacterium]|nr:heavy metal sensor histidine kinase [Legionellales bacterium]
MLWKYVKEKIYFPVKQAFISRSIILQLTGLYTFSITTILFIIACMLYLSLEYSLYKAKKSSLLNEYNFIQKNMLLKPALTASALRGEILTHTQNSSNMERYYIRMGEPGNINHVEIPGMNKIFKHNLIPDTIPNLSTRYIISSCKECRKKALLLSGWITLPSPHAPIPIQIVLGMHKENALLIDYWQILISLFIAGVILSAIPGWLLARYSMKPLYKVMQTIESTSTKKLDERLILGNWPREFTHLANNLNAMFDRLEDSFKRLTQFSADLAHELRTPINNLKGEAELCLIKTRPLDDYQQVLVSSVEEYDRLARIIESLLFLARVDTPVAHLQRVAIVAEEQLKNIFEYYQPVAEERNIKISLEGQLTIMANELLFQRVLHNICSNALRYTQDGGQIQAKMEMQKGKAAIIIQDSGIGIPAEALPCIFNRFYRVDAARSEASGGSGLGLAIVKSIVELHGGEILINSELGKGTTVTLIFPSVPGYFY